LSLDPITSEVIKNSLIYASEEMGIAVRNSAYSPNIKERLDHSCAVFDRRGRLVAQAEHIPVHLGSLPWGLTRTLEVLHERGEAMAPGEMWVVNDPYISGTHLNDVTVIRPIFWNGNLVGYTANKAHHDDVGGAVPGSMAADARELFVEGVAFTPLRIMERGAVSASVVDVIRSNSRSPEVRSGDLKAQLAGNVTGERRVIELIERYGFDTYEAALERILLESERRTRAALRELPQGVYEAEDFLEDPSGEPSVRLRATITIGDGQVTVDYAGTSRQVPVPINSVFGVTLAGVYYALRAITDPTIPMNEGCFRPVHVIAEEGCVLRPIRPAPVSAGNTETSARNADVLLAALAKAAPERVYAACGGTVSNIMGGGVRDDGSAWTFYETNGCGMGGRPTADGIDAVHCNMTNTLNTPIEGIERYFPLRVVRYEFAENTGGRGKYRGGCGLIRAHQLVEGEATLVLVADRHRLRPPGTNGGDSGETGSHKIVRDGKEEPLPVKTIVRVRPGDTVIVQTPGGGGHGDPAARDEESRARDKRNGLVRETS
jgi:N-methylhydantoinase B